jgi:hypothetical protein
MMHKLYPKNINAPSHEGNKKCHCYKRRNYRHYVSWSIPEISAGGAPTPLIELYNIMPEFAQKVEIPCEFGLNADRQFGRIVQRAWGLLGCFI